MWVQPGNHVRVARPQICIYLSTTTGSILIDVFLKLIVYDFLTLFCFLGSVRDPIGPTDDKVL